MAAPRAGPLVDQKAVSRAASWVDARAGPWVAALVAEWAGPLADAMAVQRAGPWVGATAGLWAEY